MKKSYLWQNQMTNTKKKLSWEQKFELKSWAKNIVSEAHVASKYPLR